VKAEVQKLVSSLILMPGLRGESACAGGMLAKTNAVATAIERRLSPTRGSLASGSVGIAALDCGVAHSKMTTGH
jgi:hypothetical protein